VLVGPGDAVDVQFTKWGGGRHWEFPVTVLGIDGLGVWCGAPVGTRLERVGAGFTSQFDWVTLFPVGQPWVASYYDSPDQPVSVYVDVTTPPVWAGSTVTMVDLDLDVIVTRDGDLLLDDEDEFDEHRVTLGYPDDVVALARRTADELMAAAWDGREPFGAEGGAWLPQVGSARR
jgi:uncharacterized protein